MNPPLRLDRAHREWTPAQIGFIANVVRLYRGEALDFTLGGDEAKAKLLEVFGNPKSKIENRKCRAELPRRSGLVQGGNH